MILKHIIQQGWLKTIKEVLIEVQKYWTFHEELTIEDGLILKGTRIIIPDKKREEILKLIHKRSSRPQQVQNEGQRNCVLAGHK